ncbi:MAG: Fatty acid hydroxylase [uncultured Aureispira sp.]|uniref:Fatty acid hydroxylase n=1 Tax=uncultured Aureispira sp. TaxID=1331704 RepID=A0A6S6UAS8_9BACT|nr:MAG: Fatty acid hydroxylase [uncultured Aureispira sp.]
MKGNDQFVSAKNESPRMFENDILDYFSRAHPITVPIIFVPIILYFIYSAFNLGLTLTGFAGMFFAGILVWTLFEYFLHRYLFHLQIDSDWGRRMHFMIHGCHHDYPNDAMRLVIPTGASLFLAVMMYWFFYFFVVYLFGGSMGMHHGFFASFVIGYVTYDMMHYATHYAKFKNKWFRDIQKNHLDHHYVDHDKGFGLSNVFWDRVFGTDQESIKKKNK